MIIQKQIQINTNKKTELINITPLIQQQIKNTIKNGIINISTKHTTTSIIINEDEENLKKRHSQHTKRNNTKQRIQS